MTKKLTIVVLVLVVFGTWFYLYSGRNRNLRGWWTATSDGKTYLVIEDRDGSEESRCTLDGQPWTYRDGQRGEIKPGVHELRCHMKVGFNVPSGVEYHFDYWGP
jgi:hypothetical protein